MLALLVVLTGCRRPEPPPPAPPPEPDPPIAVTFETIEDPALAEKLVTIEGYFSAPSYMFSYGGEPPYWRLNLRQHVGGGESVEVSIAEGDGPNTMQHLASGFDPADLRVRTATGELVGPDDRVRLTGKVWRNADAAARKHSLTLERIESFPRTAAELEPVDVAYDRFCDPAFLGRVVAVEGYLDSGYLLMVSESGGRTSYKFYLRRTPDEFTLTTHVELFVGTGPNEVEPIAENFDPKKIRVRTVAGKPLGLGTRVRVVGDLTIATGADGGRECTIAHPRIEEAAAPKAT